eukprot:Gb_29666 [translate_table: standard]
MVKLEKNETGVDRWIRSKYANSEIMYTLSEYRSLLQSILWDNGPKSTKQTLKEMIAHHSSVELPEGKDVIKSRSLADLADVYGEQKFYRTVEENRALWVATSRKLGCRRLFFVEHCFDPRLKRICIFIVKEVVAYDKSHPENRQEHQGRSQSPFSIRCLRISFPQWPSALPLCPPTGLAGTNGVKENTHGGQVRESWRKECMNRVRSGAIAKNLWWKPLNGWTGKKIHEALKVAKTVEVDASEDCWELAVVQAWRRIQARSTVGEN